MWLSMPALEASIISECIHASSKSHCPVIALMSSCKALGNIKSMLEELACIQEPQPSKHQCSMTNLQNDDLAADCNNFSAYCCRYTGARVGAADVLQQPLSSKSTLFTTLPMTSDPFDFIFAYLQLNPACLWC